MQFSDFSLIDGGDDGALPYYSFSQSKAMMQFLLNPKYAIGLLLHTSD